MAQKVQILLEDDIDGGEAQQTVPFALDGTSYEIDLNDANAAKLREALAIYVDHGRKIGARPQRRRRTASVEAGGTSAKVIREWARGNGYTVPDRGRIPADVRAAFEAAN